MYAVEKISSYITRGVYTVSAPFHPFGGAVDIIVVQQEDGSYKSSPWYVRFGKFQGVLKAKEKVVNICVNGVEAGFHMYLDHTGEAFFMKESDSAGEGEFVISSPPSSGDEVNDKMGPMVFQKVTSCDYDAEGKPVVTLENGNGQIVTRTTSRRSQILGRMFGRRSMKESVKSGEVQRVNSMERAQIAADLLETRWSTGSPMSYKEGTETSKEESVSVGGEKLEGTPKHNIVRGVHFEETAPSTYTLETCDFGDGSKVITESVIKSEDCCLSTKASILNNFIQDAKILGSTELSDGREVTSSSHVETLESSPISFDIPTETHKTLTSDHRCEVTSKSELDQASDMDFSKVEDSFISPGQDDVNVDRSCCPSRVGTAEDESKFQSLKNLDEEQFPFDIDSFSINDIKQEESTTNPNSESDDIDEHDSENPNHEDCIERVAEVSVIHSFPLAIPRSKKHLGETEFLDANYGEIDLLAKSLPIIRSQVHDTEGSNLLHPLSCSLHLNSENVGKEISLALKLKKDAEEKPEISEAVDSENIGGYSASPIKSAVDLSVSKELQFEGTGADASSSVFDAEKQENIYEPQGTVAIDHDEKNFNDSKPSGPIAQSGGSWSIWPFSIKKSKTISTVRSPPESPTQEDNNVVVAPIRSHSLNDRDDIQGATIRKPVRSLTPTSEELASLNLNEGGNVITFRFSTAMLGQQQVDARIYLWKWNTRIVISDVDGTITKSDVLGQFMPLVGKDWSQTGVAHLFSAIKENGYQVLFLSARSISQAYITRQFLLTLKQDGKALPDGPVVISPDGLFPSLYREVIRRAPHEFKIKCLEDIKALFPPESGPFYAGFGNRDTDEISYLKVGVPKGKIFIINPKGEVAVNRRVNTKSYTSLHALVNGMFPPESTIEQEDFNDLNFWKLPLPDTDI